MLETLINTGIPALFSYGRGRTRSHTRVGAHRSPPTAIPSKPPPPPPNPLALPEGEDRYGQVLRYPLAGDALTLAFAPDRATPAAPTSRPPSASIGLARCFAAGSMLFFAYGLGLRAPDEITAGAVLRAPDDITAGAVLRAPDSGRACPLPYGRRARPAPRAYGLHIGSSPASSVWSCPRCRSLSSPLRGSSVSRPALTYVHRLHHWRCYAPPVASFVRVLPLFGVGRSPPRQQGRYGSSPIPRA